MALSSWILGIIVSFTVSSAILISLSSSPARAAGDDSDADKTREEQVAERAKRRQYPGGPDESDLKVQNPLPTPTRKIAPAVDDEKSESAAATED